MTDGNDTKTDAGENADTGTPVTPPTTSDDAVSVRLTELKVNAAVITQIKDELGATSVDDLANLTEEDLLGVGMKKLPARRLLDALAPEPPAAPAQVSAMSLDTVLPTVPGDSSWLKDLKTGGALKVEESTIIAAIRSALAHKVGLYAIPQKLVDLMEKFTDESEDQVDPEFFKIRKQLTRRSYGDLFEAIPGLDGSYVTVARKKELFDRIDRELWPSIREFFAQLQGWQESWMKGAANPMMMMQAVVAAAGGGGGGVMPPGMMSPPDTSGVRDYADAVADATNRVFKGVGVQISAALAFEATEIRESLTNKRLPALTGAVNRDQMLRQLDAAVSATYPRLERNLIQFVLGVLQARELPDGQESVQYFGALYMLGSQIPWDTLNVSSSDTGLTGIGGGRVPRRGNG